MIADVDDTAAEPMIKVRGLTKHYGDRAVVDRLDLDVAEGEVFGLLGPNGAGKTTTILMLLGLTEPSAGTVRVFGMDPTRRPLDVKSMVGYLPDDVGFYRTLSGWENLAYTAALNRIPRAEMGDRIEGVLAEVGLTDAAHQAAGTYSRGMKQRLGIADALLKDPRVLILDEPTIGIDPEGVADMLALLTRLTRERSVTVLLSSHLLQQVQQICHRVAIFVDGRIMAQGDPESLLDEVATTRVSIEFKVESGGERVPELVQGIADVGEVREAGRGGEWVVEAERDVTAEIAAALVAGGLRLRSLRRLDVDLDRVYHRFFEEQS